MRTEERIEDIALVPISDLAEVPRADLLRMAAAAGEIAEVYRALGKTGDNVVGELLRNSGTFYEWDHYPPGDVFDHETSAQYYYHAHPPAQRFAGEHGHFHTFLRPKGMPEGVRPAPLPDFEGPAGDNDALSHLVAIAMTPAGSPFRLFTVNRWVTGETWYLADDVCRMQSRFAIGHARPSWPVNRWITAMLRLFEPQITALLRRRDRTIGDWQARHPGSNVYEDRDLEVASCMDIDVAEQAVAVEQALAACPEPAPSR